MIASKKTMCTGHRTRTRCIRLNIKHNFTFLSCALYKKCLHIGVAELRLYLPETLLTLSIYTLHIIPFLFIYDFIFSLLTDN